MATEKRPTVDWGRFWNIGWWTIDHIQIALTTKVYWSITGDQAPCCRYEHGYKWIFSICEIVDVIVQWKKNNLLLNNDLATIHPLINIQFFEDNKHFFLEECDSSALSNNSVWRSCFFGWRVQEFVSPKHRQASVWPPRSIFFYRLKFMIMKITTRCLLF